MARMKQLAVDNAESEQPIDTEYYFPNHPVFPIYPIIFYNQTDTDNA